MALSSDVARRVAIKKMPHCGKRSAASRLMRASDHCDFLPPRENIANVRLVIN